MEAVDLPLGVQSVFREFMTCEFATIGKSGAPIAWPVMPVYQSEPLRFTLPTAIGLSQKAANARRNPRVSLLFSDPTGSNLGDPPAVLVQGDATVSDEIFSSLSQVDEPLRVALIDQAQKMFARQPGIAAYASNPISRFLISWYFIRLGVFVKPRRILWWEHRDFAQAPREMVLGTDEAEPTVQRKFAVPMGAREVAETPVGAGDLAKAYERWSRLLPTFPSAVLTVPDPSGYPYSLRCQTRENGHGAICLALPEWVDFAPAPASLLCHRHDERLWNLRSFVLRGSLERDAKGWLLKPREFVPGMGVDGILGWLRFIRDARLRTIRYLRRHNQAWPSVDWKEIEELLTQARQQDRLDQ